jgi:hypothetical protein
MENTHYVYQLIYEVLKLKSLDFIKTKFLGQQVDCQLRNNYSAKSVRVLFPNEFQAVTNSWQDITSNLRTDTTCVLDFICQNIIQKYVLKNKIIFYGTSSFGGRDLIITFRLSNF